MNILTRTLRSFVFLFVVGALPLTAVAQDQAAWQKQDQEDQARLDRPELSEEDPVKIGIQAVGGLQLLDHSNDPGSLRDIEGGFQNAAGNMTFDARITDGIDVYAELYLSSPNHVGDVYDREGYLYVDYLPEMFGSVNKIFRYVDLKAGHMELNFGDQHFFRSDVAQVGNNPLFGNYIVDANTIGVGAELYGDLGPLTAMIGYNSGSTTGDFTDGRRNAWLGKLAYGELDGPVRLSGSVYRVNQSRNGTGFPAGGSSSNMFAGNFSGSRYQAVWEGSPTAGQLTLGAGQDVTAYQFDARVKPLPALTLSGLFGVFEDADLNGNASGSPTSEWTYYGATAQYYLADPFFVAARYNAASASTLQDNDSDGIVQRFQVGFGLEIVPDQLVFKTEYVNQWANDFAPGQKVLGRNPGVDLATEPKFYGVVAEVAVSF